MNSLQELDKWQIPNRGAWQVSGVSTHVHNCGFQANMVWKVVVTTKIILPYVTYLNTCLKVSFSGIYPQHHLKKCCLLHNELMLQKLKDYASKQCVGFTRIYIGSLSPADCQKKQLNRERNGPDSRHTSVN